MNRSWNWIFLTNEKPEFFNTDQSQLRMSLQKNNDENNYDEVEEEGVQKLEPEVFTLSLYLCICICVFVRRREGCAEAGTRCLHSFFRQHQAAL